jgi:hypothetical protein
VVDRRKNRIYFRFHRDGYLYPADNYAASQLRSRGYKMGDVVSVNITKLRSPGFNRLAHKIGQLVSSSIDAFHGMEAHLTLKRLQLEANAACEEIMINVAGSDVLARIPKSLSFESLDEGEFNAAIKKICNHIVDRYWQTETPETIERMALQWVEAA